MKRFLSLILALLVALAPAGAAQSFASANSEHLRVLSRKMKKNFIKSTTMQVVICESSVIMKICNNDERDWCVDRVGLLIDRDDFVSPKLRLFIRMSIGVATSMGLERLEFNVEYTVGARDYYFTFLKIKSKYRGTVCNLRLKRASFERVQELISDSLRVVPRELESRPVD